MTICIGLLAQDGVVVASDSQESFGFLKGDTQKIMVALDSEAPATFAISGSGDGPYVDAISLDLVNIALDHKGKPPKDLQTGIQNHLTKFYENHVIPFSNYPTEERPDFDLLFANGSKKYGEKIWTTSRNLVYAVPLPYAAVGVGRFQ
jgi:hypothetical protein